VAGPSRFEQSWTPRDRISHLWPSLMPKATMRRLISPLTRDKNGCLRTVLIAPFCTLSATIRLSITSRYTRLNRSPSCAHVGDGKRHKARLRVDVARPGGRSGVRPSGVLSGRPVVLRPAQQRRHGVNRRDDNQLPTLYAGHFCCR
jgi:hypothetical protein